MLRLAVEPIEKVRASRAWPFPLGPVHEAVNRQRVLAGLEQRRELHLPAIPIELIILRDHAASRQRSALGGNALDLAPQLHLLGEQSVARGAILSALAWKVHVMQDTG